MQIDSTAAMKISAPMKKTKTETVAAIIGAAVEPELSDESTNITVTGGDEKSPAPTSVTACTCGGCKPKRRYCRHSWATERKRIRQSL